jgi:hypothetical protein
MALTNPQRQTALQAILACSDFQAISPIPSGIPLATLLPGVTIAEVLATLITALNGNADASFQTVINNLLAQLNAQLTTAEASVTTIQAQIAAL